MIGELDIKKYVDEFGNDLINDVTETILKNNWVDTGNLLNSLEYTSQEFKDSVKAELFIADYYVYLKDGVRKAPKVQARTRGVSATTQRTSNKTLSQRVDVADNRVTFVTPLLNQNINTFEQQIVPKIEKDLTKLITDKINNAIK
jgi:hypothetical protein